MSSHAVACFCHLGSSGAFSSLPSPLDVADVLGGGVGAAAGGGGGGGGGGTGSGSGMNGLGGGGCED